MEGSRLLMFRQLTFVRILVFAPMLLNLSAQAQQPGGSPTSSAAQLPLSGRTGQSGSVTTNQSTINTGGANSVNLINSTVNVQGPYTGSVQNGKAIGTTISLTLADAIRQGLQYNLGSVTSAQGIRQAQGERYSALNALLPQVNSYLREDVQQTDLVAFGFK